MGDLGQRGGVPFRQPEWSTAALIEAPHLFGQHMTLIAAGADDFDQFLRRGSAPYRRGTYAERADELLTIAAREARGLPRNGMSVSPPAYRPCLAPICPALLILHVAGR